MQLYKPAVEIRALKTVLDSIDTIKKKLEKKLTVDFFGDDCCREIFLRIKSLKELGKPIPSSSIFKEDIALSEKARELLSGRLQGAASQADSESLLALLLEYKKLRVVDEVVHKSLHELKSRGNEKEGKSIDDVLNDFCSMLSLAQDNLDPNDEVLTLGKKLKGESGVDAVLEDILTGSPPDFIKTGFKDFDDKSGGLSRQTLTVLMSNSSGGKSVLGMQMGVDSYAKYRRNVCIISFELSAKEYWTRVLSNVTERNIELLFKRSLSIKQRESVDTVDEALKAYGAENNCKLTVDCPDVSLSMMELGRRLKGKNYDLVVVDMLNQLKPPSPSMAEYQSFAASARDAKLVSKILDCAVILLVQMDEGMKVEYSRGVFENADNVWAWDYSDREKETGVIDIHQQKARNGEQFNFLLKAEYGKMSLSDYTGSKPEELISKINVKAMDGVLTPEDEDDDDL